MEEERRGGGGGGGGELVLVGRKGCFGLPTACPSSLPVYIYLRFAKASFNLHCDANNPDSDHVPYVEFDDCVIFNNENGGVIEGLKKEGIADLDSSIPTSLLPDWLSIKAMVCSWLYEAAQYELWVSSDGSVAHEIYYSGLSWPIGKALQWKQSRYFKNFFGITNINGEEKEAEIYRKAGLAYEALSLKLGEQTFFFDNRPTSLDAIFLGHVLFVLHALPHVLERGRPLERSQIISKVAGQIVHMSQHKFASNVIEKCLERGSPEERDLLIEEIVGQTEGNDNLLVMMKDQFANYVVQKVLETCNDRQQEILLGRIIVHLQALKKYTYGKHIVARVEQLCGEDSHADALES